MRLYALIGDVQVKKFPAFDPKTGEPDPNYILQAMATDFDNPQALYQCSFDAGFGLEDLKAAKKAKATEADRDALAAQVEAQAKQLQGQRVELVIKRAKAKGGFLSLAVLSVQALPEEFLAQAS